MENDMLKLSERLVELRTERDDTEAMLADIKSDIEKTEYALVMAMTESETPNFTHSGSQFVLTNKTRASSVAGEKEALYSALREHGYGDIITETINANTLSSAVKGLIEENAGNPCGSNALPDWLDGLVNVFEKTGVTVKKTNRK